MCIGEGHVPPELFLTSLSINILLYKITASINCIWARLDCWTSLDRWFNPAQSDVWFNRFRPRIKGWPVTNFKIISPMHD